MEKTAVNKRVVRQMARMANRFLSLFCFMLPADNFPTAFLLLFLISCPSALYDFPVFYMDDPVAQLGELFGMGDHDNGLEKPGIGQLQQTQYLLGGPGIQVPGWLVCQK